LRRADPGYAARVNRRREIIIAASALAVLWAGLAYDRSRPVAPSSYHRTLTQVAEAAHDAASTGVLVAEQELAGRVTSAYTTAAFDDATSALAGAQRQFAAVAPPDPASAADRDRLAPLLGAAVRALGDTAAAPDDAARRDGVRKLGELTASLDEFLGR